MTSQTVIIHGYLIDEEKYCKYYDIDQSEFYDAVSNEEGTIIEVVRYYDNPDDELCIYSCEDYILPEAL